MTNSEISWTRKGERYSYTLTDDDYLTLARAVAHEGAPYDGVVWCLIQRFAWVYPVYTSFSDFVEAYAQPINPRWFPDGDLHLSYLKRNRVKPERIRDEKRRAALRLEYATMPLEDIDSKYLDVINRVLSGNASSTVPGAVHYSASFARVGSNERTAFVSAGQFGKQRRMGPVIDSGAGYRRGVNWFFAAGGSHRVDLDLRIAPPAPELVTSNESDAESESCET